MRRFGHASQNILCLVAVVALVGMAAPAHAIPQRLTFAGPETGRGVCFEVSCRYDPPGGIVRYTFVVDFERLGEQIVRDASGETVTTYPGTFFAELLGGPLPTVVGAPGLVEVHTITHIGRGLTLTDVQGVSFTNSSGFLLTGEWITHKITGQPGADWTNGSHFDGEHNHRERELPIDIFSDVHSALTLIVAEPGTFVVIGAGVVVLASMTLRSLRWRDGLANMGGSLRRGLRVCPKSMG